MSKRPTSQTGLFIKGNGESKKPQLWNSLEVAKLTIPAISSMLLVVVGYAITTKLEHLKQDIANTSQSRSALINKRLDLYEILASSLYKIVNYHTYSGHWDGESLERVIKYKWDADEAIYSNRPLFSDRLLDRYGILMDELFIHGKSGSNMTLRATSGRRAGLQDTAFKATFTEEDNSSAICSAYEGFISALVDEFETRTVAEIQVIKVSCKDLPVSKEAIAPIPTDDSAKTRKFLSAPVSATSVGDNQIAEQCFVPDPGWAFDPESANIVIDKNMQNESGPLLSKAILQYKSSDRLCIIVQSRPLSFNSRAYIVAHIEANLLRKP